MSRLFSGVLPAVMTPFDAGLAIDEGELAGSVEWLIGAGSSGLVATGTMGEASALSEAEREHVAEVVVGAAAGRVPVIVGVSSDTPDRAGRLARVALRAGARGLMCTPPPSYRADERELVAFFTAVASATDLPLMVYNNPSVTHNDMPPQLIAELSAVDTVSAVKETSGDCRRIAEILDLTDGAMEVLVGGDDWALEAAAAGATGWVTGCGVVAPVESIALFEGSMAGNFDRARHIYRHLLPLARLDMQPKLVQYFKAALDKTGRYGGPCRPPRLPLTGAEVARVAAAVETLRRLAGPPALDSSRPRASRPPPHQ
jgi:dihydrodipicolinate synthase/N-acetylneuraminate lyase